MCIFALTFLFKFQFCNVLFGWSVTPMCTGPTSRPYGDAISLICHCNRCSAFSGKVSGLQWSSLYLILSQLCLQWPPPLVLVVHAGGNDIGKQKT